MDGFVIVLGVKKIISYINFYPQVEQPKEPESIKIMSRGRTIGDFLHEVFAFFTENWIVILIVLGFLGYGPCAVKTETTSTKNSTKVEDSSSENSIITEDGFIEEERF